MIRVIRIIHQNLQSCIYKKKKKKTKTKTASKANTQPSTEFCRVRIRIILILWFVYMSIHGEWKSTTSCLLLSMSTMSTLDFKYGQYEYDIKISMNAYKYHTSFEYYRFEYSLRTSDTNLRFTSNKPTDYLLYYGDFIWEF